MRRVRATKELTQLLMARKLRDPYDREKIRPSEGWSASSFMREQQKLAEFLVPDAEYIRRDLPISEVAEKLGLDVRDRRVRCARDRSHWARIWLKKNKVKCFKCGAGACWSTIDLARDVLQVDVNRAIQWIAIRFDVPKRRRRITRNLWGTTRHLYVDYPDGKRPRRLEISLDALRRSPVWANLKPTARRLAIFLIGAVPRDSLILSITHRDLQLKVEAGNRGTVKRAFAQLCEIGLVETQREATGNEGFGFYASKTVVRLTWGSERFQSSLAAAGRGNATEYIGSKLSHDIDKKVNHENDPETVKKVDHGTGLERSTFSPQEVCGDFSSFTSYIGMGIRYAGHNQKVEVIRRELGGIFGLCDEEQGHPDARGQQSLVRFSGVPEKTRSTRTGGES
jgi:hypothetical protein